MSERVTTRRKDRTVDGERQRGKVHIWIESTGLTVCGRPLRGVVATRYAQPMSAVTCGECLAWDARGARRPYSRR